MIQRIECGKVFPEVETLPFIFEEMKLKKKPDTLWLEFGVWQGTTINYISKFTEDIVYGFDSFEGLPEKWRDGFDKGMFSIGGSQPEVNNNVVLVKGWFNETLENFIKEQNKKISFIHLDADLYSSTKYVFETVKDYLDTDCVIAFDEMFFYPGWSENGEYKAFCEFISENNVDWEWIGGPLLNEQSAIIIHSISPLEKEHLS